MTSSNSIRVRPTKRCLDDLGLGFPPLEQPLDNLAHPVVAKAQQVPKEVAANGAERVLVAKDLVWFKIKIGRHRAIVTELDRDTESRPEIMQANAWWWIGAAGKRKQDSDDDFYNSLESECQRAGRNTGSASSTHLLPTTIDIRRLQGELATQTIYSIRTVVCGLVARSIQDGKVWTAELRSHRISAHVQARDGEAYLSVGAEGFIHPNILAVILAAVPGIAAEDWLPEPEGTLSIDPRPGEILYSAIIPPEFQSRIVDEFLDES